MLWKKVHIQNGHLGTLGPKHSFIFLPMNGGHLSNHEDTWNCPNDGHNRDRAIILYVIVPAHSSPFYRSPLSSPPLCLSLSLSPCLSVSLILFPSLPVSLSLSFFPSLSLYPSLSPLSLPFLLFIENITTLFRSSTLTTMLMEQFMKLTSMEYLLSVIKQPILDIIACPDSCEVCHVTVM